MGETHIALFSGGQDSAVATHLSMRYGPCEVVMYLDTGTGTQRNREYVRRFCDRYGWHLVEWRTPENYEELVRQYGFPGPSTHAWFYRYLKERQLSKFATLGDELHFWTGVHKAESQNRMNNVEDQAEDGSGRWYWHAPCADWQPREFRTYLERFNLPRNPLWRTLGRSGDCYCGAYANRMELIDLEALGEDRADELRRLEETITADACGFDEQRREEWAWHDDRKHVADAMDDDDQMLLCSDCGVSNDG